MPPSWACAAAAGGAIGVGILKMPVELTSRLKMEEIGDNVPVLLERWRSKSRVAWSNQRLDHHRVSEPCGRLESCCLNPRTGSPYNFNNSP